LIRISIVANSSWRAEELGSMLAEDQHLEVVETRVASALKDEVFAPAVDVVVIAGMDTRRLRLQHSCIVVLTDVLPRAENIDDAVGGPVRARLPMQSPAAQISAAVIAAAQDFYVLSRDQIQGRISSSGTSATDEVISERLTAREKQVLRMMADGLGNKEIAHALGVSNHTAKFHVSQVLGKLGTSTRAEAVRIGIRRGFVPI
jgi:DNA-binding NarL/FixJ family response regulator